MSTIGEVNKWDEQRGFGFIASAGQRDIFVHRACLVDTAVLTVGDKVMYDAVFDQKKNKMMAVTCKIVEHSSTRAQTIPTHACHFSQQQQQHQPRGSFQGSHRGSILSLPDQRGSVQSTYEQPLWIPQHEVLMQQNMLMMDVNTQTFVHPTFVHSPTFVSSYDASTHASSEPSPNRWY